MLLSGLFVLACAFGRPDLPTPDLGRALDPRTGTLYQVVPLPGPDLRLGRLSAPGVGAAAPLRTKQCVQKLLRLNPLFCLVVDEQCEVNAWMECVADCGEMIGYVIFWPADPTDPWRRGSAR